MEHAGLDAEVDVHGRARAFGSGPHHGVRDLGGDRVSGDAWSEQLTGSIHTNAGDALGFGHEGQLSVFLDRSQRVHDRV